jgi:hypothetical protein
VPADKGDRAQEGGQAGGGMSSSVVGPKHSEQPFWQAAVQQASSEAAPCQPGMGWSQ